LENTRVIGLAMIDFRCTIKLSFTKASGGVKEDGDEALVELGAA